MSAPGETELFISAEPDNPTLRGQLDRALEAHNIAVTRISEFAVVAFGVRDREGHLLGGIRGEAWGGWFHVEVLWLDESIRGRGLGTRLLLDAEAAARGHGAAHAFLETHWFQARAFYERNGYGVVGELPDYPPGGSYYVMRKDLA